MSDARVMDRSLRVDRSLPNAVARPRTRRWQTRELLREMILDGRLPAGSRLIQQELASQLKTSIGMVRELLLELAGMGLVEMEENQGFFVSTLDLRKLRDTYLVRAMHEGLAARLCCERASRKDFQEFREMAEKIRVLHESGSEEDHREAAALDRAFHAALVRIADNEPLARAWRSHWIPMAMSKGPASPRRQRSYHEHMAIIEAIEQDRPDEAERLVRRHVDEGLRYVRERIEAGEADLSWLV